MRLRNGYRSLIPSHPRRIALVLAQQPLLMEKPLGREKNRTANALFVMMAIVRILMPLCSVTDAIWLCTRSVMACLSSRKANGYAASVNWLEEDQSTAFFVPTPRVLSNKPRRRNGLIFFAPSGFQRCPSATRP